MPMQLDARKQPASRCKMQLDARGTASTVDAASYHSGDRLTCEAAQQNKACADRQTVVSAQVHVAV